MDETAVEATHDLMLDMAGRVDDDLLSWARELAAVGETQHAVELISATLAADRTELPGPTRDALVEAARSVRIELDADRALAAPVPADGGTPHRFDAAPAAAVLAAVRALPARLLVGCRVLLAGRVTPAGSAPGPLPHPVVLVEVSLGARNRDVLAYQLADALDRAGVRASVEVISADQRLPAYHVEALRCARPVPPVGPDGGRARVPDEPSARSDRPTAPAPVPLRVAAARTAVTVEHNPAVPEWDDPMGNPVWAEPGAPNGVALEAARSNTGDRAGSVEPAPAPGGAGSAAAGSGAAGSAPARSAPTGSAPTGSARAGSDEDGSALPTPDALDSPALDPPAAAPVVLDANASEPARPDAVAAPSTAADSTPSDPTATGPEATDPTASDAATFPPAPTEPGAPGSAASAAEPDPTDPTSAGPEPAEPPARNHPGPDAPRSQPAPVDHRPGPRPLPVDRTPRPSVPRNDDAEPIWPRPVGPQPGDERTTLTALPQRRHLEPPGADPTSRIDAPGLPAGERRHRYLIERSEPAPTADEIGVTGPHGTGRNPLVRAEGGNTEPLIIRTPDPRQTPEPHPADRADPSGGPGIFATDAGDRAAPAGLLPGGPGPAELGLRPESVARLSESGRELLARLQAELQGSGTALGPRPGGLGPNRGGNGAGPQAKVDPPDLAG